MEKSEEVREQLIEMLPRRISNSPSNMRKFKAYDEVIKYVREQEELTTTVKRYFTLKAKGITTEAEALEHLRLLKEIKEMVGIKE